MRKYFILTMLLCMSFFHAIAQETVTVDNIKYYIENGEATIAVQDENLSGDIVIPESISYNGNNYVVIRATNGAFQNTDITSIILPNSITALGNICFRFCHNLTSVKLPDNITSLGDETFMNCNITKLTLPNSITTIGQGCFYSCSNLETVTLPQNITNLPASCFKDCKKLSGIILHEGIISLKDCVFENCLGLTSIKLPKSINILARGCFKGCSNLSEVTCLWNNLDDIDVANSTFNNIFSEAKLYIPKGTTEIYKAKEPWSNFKYIIEENDITEDAEKCQTPTISYSDKKLTFTSPTEGAEYHYTITDDDVKTEAYSEDGIIDLSATYEISVYASADGYKNSDRATATLYFINAGLENTTDVLQIEEQRGVLISTDGGYISISGLDDNEKVYLYNLQGVSLAEGTACAGTVSLNTGNEKGIVIVKIGEQSIKVKLNH